MSARLAILVPLLALVGLLQSCGGSSGSGSPPPPPAPPPETRSFELGFTPWPYDATAAAVNFVYTEAASQGDFIAHHLDGGIPWEEALNGAPYSAELESELSTRLNNTPAGMRTYLALSPLSGGRDALAGYWGTATNQPLPPPWDTREFDDPTVIKLNLVAQR